MNRMARALCLAAAALLVSSGSLAAHSPARQNAPGAGDAASLVKQGQELNRQGKQEEALALYRRALEISPNLYEGHLAAGMALDLMGRYKQARKHLARAIRLAPAPSRVRALRTMAVSYAFTRNAKKAAKFERQAFDAELAAGDFNAAGEIADELARIDLESGDLSGAARWYRTGHETAFRKPNLTEAEKDLWNFRWEHAQARIAARRGERTGAEQHVAAAKAILDRGRIPQQARFFPYLAGYVAFYTGDDTAAIADLEKADQRDPYILGLLGQAAEKAGNETQAIAYYRKVLASNAHNLTNAFARPLAEQKLAKAGS
jgi:tetratricopeptide (TPR) repeat protein